MTLAGIAVHFATTRFTATEAQFFTAGIKQGLSRNALREVFRDSFNRGFSNQAFAEARKVLTAADRAGIQLQRLKPSSRLSIARIPGVPVENARYKFMVSGSVQTRLRGTGETVTRVIRFGTDELPTMDMIKARGQDILDKGTAQTESSLDIEIVESLSVFRQINV